MIGETVKDFKISSLLGRGGMGEVYVGTQQIVQTRVAIKLLREDISSDRQHVQRFFNEAITASKIKHAGIVKIFDVGFHGQRAFLIMEYLEGESLAARIRRPPRVALHEIVDTTAQLASILDATHAASVTHRDLKPDNIFVVADAELASKRRVKVLDFGIAKLGAASAEAASPEVTAMTLTNSSMGTPAYMAPEQWADAASADSRADVYSLGCVIFELCCSRPPFVVTTMPEACAKHMNEVPPRMRSLVPELPAAIDDLVAAMLAKKPDERPTMTTVVTTFAALRATYPIPGQPAPPASVVAGDAATALPANAITADGSPATGQSAGTSATTQPEAGQSVGTSATTQREAAESSAAALTGREASGASAAALTGRDASGASAAALTGREASGASAAALTGRETSGASAAALTGREASGASAAATTTTAGAGSGTPAAAREPASSTAPAHRVPAWSSGVVAGIAALAVAGVVIVVLARRGGERAPAPPPPTTVTTPVVTPPVPDPVVIPPAAGCPRGMVRVPGGEFLMGTDNGLSWERPAHVVTLSSAYCLDATEVTVGDYTACVATGACKPAPTTVMIETEVVPENHWPSHSKFCNGDREDRARHPINCVNWDHATAYCAFAGKRLPTEAEWEFAARGGGDRIYPWGNQAPSGKLVNLCGAECRVMARNFLGADWWTAYPDNDGWGATAPVGSFPEGKSPTGTLDMAGNVAEWTADVYAAYTAGPVTDPKGPPTGPHRVVRDSSWRDAKIDFARSTSRMYPLRERVDDQIGFRCARDLDR